MQIQKKEKYTLVYADESSFDEFYQSFLDTINSFSKEHLILDFSKFNSLNEKDFLLFLSIAEQKRENGTSFAIVNKDANVDKYPESFNIVPTMTEAEDILEMEAIERELGF